jgi:hypothetical protein
MYKLKVPIAESKYVGVEPIWADGYEPEDYQREYGNALNWYNYIVDAKDCRAFLVDYYKSDKEKLKALSQVPDKFIPRTYANTARIAMRGFPVTEVHMNRIWEKVEEVVNKRIKSDEDEPDTTTPVVKVVKPPKLASTYILALVNDEIENLIEGEDPKTMGQILMPYKMSDKQYSDCAEKLQPLLAEYAEVLELRRTDRKTLTEEQIEFMDSFKFSGITIIKKIVQLIEGYVNDLKKSYISKQVAKVRKKKPKDKTKLVRGIKFLAEDEKFGKSIDPVNLLNCSEVWTFDTKTRKLSKYYSPVGGGITVKGASLVGYEESMSSCKLLRKPEDQIPAFSATAKKDLTKWYSSVKSKNANVRPRLTATTLILKVF